MKDNQAEIWHYRYLVSKETVVQCQWEIETLAFIKWVDKGRITTMKDLESWCFEHKLFIRVNDKGLTLQMSAIQIFRNVNLSLINSFDKTPWGGGRVGYFRNFGVVMWR